MSIKPTPDNIAKMQTLAEGLVGTCISLDEVVADFFDGTEVYDLDIELLQVLDSIVMQCEICLFWCEDGELNDDQICEDCAE